MSFQSSKKLALVIGNNNYEDGKKLNCCINDAIDMGQALEKMNFNVNIAIDLTYKTMIQKILRFQRLISKDDFVLVFYSGHGVQLEDQNYFVPIDNQCLTDDYEMYYYHAVHVQFMLESMKKRQPSIIIFLLDCCRNYLLQERTWSSVSLIKAVNEKTISANFKTSSLIAFACGPNEETLENSKNGRNSMFTYHLLQHINQPNLKIDELMCRVCHGISEETDGRTCSYWLSSLRTPDIYLDILPIDLPIISCLPASYRNEKLEKRIEEFSTHCMIDVCNENLTDEDIEIVVTQAIIKQQCRELNLRNNRITSHGASILATALKNNMTLETLNISSNDISDMGVKSLSQVLSSNSSIVKLLDLGHNGITDLGVQYIAEMLRTNRTLTFLNLSNNKISDQGVQILACTIAREDVRLKEFYVNGNGLILIMAFSSASRLQLTPDMSICRILAGMWQISGGHGRLDPDAAIKEMFRYLDAGFTTWDLADIYGPAEDIMGEFRRQLVAMRGQEALNNLEIFTKWVPQPTKMTKKFVEDNINRSLRRMGVQTIDLLQFHWWDYNDSNYLDALRYLSGLQKEGKIKHLGLTNFDTDRLRIIHQAGIQIVSNQVQYSIVDRRPEVQMIPFCQQHNIKLLTYGTVCGGLFSEKYLGKPEPRKDELNTASLKKYKNMIDQWGGWALFQELLTVLKQIANKHGVSVANVAVRYILDKPAVGGVIIGARLGMSEHLQDNMRVFQFNLDADDNEKINAICRKSNDLFRAIGDCGDEYR